MLVQTWPLLPSVILHITGLVQLVASCWWLVWCHLPLQRITHVA